MNTHYNKETCLLTIRTKVHAALGDVNLIFKTGSYSIDKSAQLSIESTFSLISHISTQ